MVHEMGPVALHLLVAGYRTEHDLRESLTGESPEANSANRSPILNQRQCFVLRVKNLDNIVEIIMISLMIIIPVW